MSQGNLDYMRLWLLFADGVAMVCAFERLMHYKRWHGVDWREMVVFFMVLSVVYFCTTFSDMLVMSPTYNIWWAETPVVRGLILRVPVASVLLWMSIMNYTKTRTRRNNFDRQP